jgi:Asp-tRNA(Asn)/Glu-tRNA(Gln) amidotransferase A subunit family amidase
MGRVSLYGVIPLSYTRDHPGPLARDARDAALLLQAMAGADPMDPRTLGLPPVPDYLTAATPVVTGGRATLRWPTRIGVPPGWTDSDDATVAADRSRFLEALRDSGADVLELPPPVGWAELTSGSLNGARLPERSEIFLDVLKRDVRLFGVALAPWINGLLLSGEEYLKAQRAKLALLRLALDELFAECDVVVQTGTVPFDMIGLPLVALPVGLRQQGGRTLPHGVVLGGLPFGEERLLSVAAAWQAASDWHRVRPDDPLPSGEARSTGSPGIRRGRMGPEAVAELSQ